jgi:hypothetical protein
MGLSATVWLLHMGGSRVAMQKPQTFSKLKTDSKRSKNVASIFSCCVQLSILLLLATIIAAQWILLLIVIANNESAFCLCSKYTTMVSVMMRMGNDIMASTYSTSLKKYNFKLSC